MKKVYLPLVGAAVLLGGLAQGATSVSARIVAGKNVAIVATTAGRVQGFVRDGVETYRGIPYAQAKRFEEPQAVQSWTDVRPALSYGHICPQIETELREPQMFISDNRFWPMSEDCQNLNVWTPSTKDGKKRPVLFWIHGGGYFAGSSMDLPVYDGTNLSRKGDIVVVSINHRLNVLGFLDLSAYGEKYRRSANVSLLDIVAALRWVRENVSNFGGDPANVTIWGQSGGGAKVSNLMAMPVAKGLFKRAIVSSGSPSGESSRYSNPATAKAVAEQTLQEAGLTPTQTDRLAEIPYVQLLTAANRALDQVAGPSAGPVRAAGLSWGPVIDGDVLPEGPFVTQAPAAARDVAVMVGTTLSEFAHFPRPDQSGREAWSDLQVANYFKSRFGDRADALIATYGQAYPGMPHREWLLIDTNARTNALRQASMQAATNAPVYNYLFAWRSPVLDYAWAAGHSSDLAFAFDNAQEGVQSSGGGSAVDRLTAEMSQAWINFIRTGNPNGRGVTRWEAFTPEHRATMVFDVPSKLRVGHDTELMKTGN